MLNRPLLGWSLFIALTSASAVSRAENFTVPGSADTLQGAIDFAKANTSTDDTITVASGTYVGNLTITESLTIAAEDGAKVILRGSSTDPLIQITGSSGVVTLQRLIVSTSGPGIAANGGTVNLRNLVITSASKAIDCQNTTGEIVQVTFYRIDAGIACTGSTMTIRNNIFAIVSGIPISLLAPLSGTTALTSYNLFFQVPDPTPDEQRGSSIVEEGDPSFVDPANDDFHLSSGSPAIDVGDPNPDIVDGVDGTRSDLGAYGGPSPGAHSKPFRTEGVVVTCDPPTGTSCQVSWAANADYAVSGYRVSFSAPSAPVGGVYVGSPPGGASPQSYLKADVCSAGTTCAITLTGLSDSITAPDQPTGLTAGTGDTKLLLSWNPVASATSYEVYYGTTPGGSLVKSGVKTTETTLEGLTNGTTYYVSVKAVSQPTLFAIVNTLYGADVATTTKLSEPSDQNTGEYGTAQFSTISSEVEAAPQLVVGFPLLEDTGGCFIATAAYGSALAPQVEVLRTWRDRYLSTHPPGRAFVAAYRVVSPPIADRLRQSEGLRSLVRILLLPVVGIAWLWIAWPWMAGAFALTGIAIASGYCWSRRDPPRA